jgi:hypothetical protein
MPPDWCPRSPDRGRTERRRSRRPRGSPNGRDLRSLPRARPQQVPPSAVIAAIGPLAISGHFRADHEHRSSPIAEQPFNAHISAGNTTTQKQQHPKRHPGIELGCSSGTASGRPAPPSPAANGNECVNSSFTRSRSRSSGIRSEPNVPTPPGTARSRSKTEYGHRVAVVLILAGLLLWAGAALVIDAALRRKERPTLTDRLLPFQPSVADQAHLWLRSVTRDR